MIKFFGSLKPATQTHFKLIICLNWFCSIVGGVVDGTIVIITGNGNSDTNNTASAIIILTAVGANVTNTLLGDIHL